MEHNKSISKSDWFNKETKNYDCDYFDCVYNQKEKQDNGDFKSTIYVMEDDDCFDLLSSNNDKFKYSIEILNEIKKELINSLGIANNGSDWTIGYNEATMSIISGIDFKIKDIEELIK